MKKILLICAILLLQPVFAIEENLAIENNKIQTKINEVGVNILNSNGIDKRVIFVYDESEKKELLKNTKTLTKREVVLYKNNYKSIENDDELAGYLAREIVAAARSYNGLWKGCLGSLQMKAAPKKFEIVYDKLAVDYVVKAGYNPIGLITYINKTCPQCRQDKLSSKNLTSKRLAHIYERIYIQNPEFLENNIYITNRHYQNFLLTSQNNRKMLVEKCRNNNIGKELDYE